MEGGDGIPPMVKIKQEVIEEEGERQPSETEGYQIFFMAEDAIKEEEMTQDDVEEHLRQNDSEQNSLQDVDVEMPVTTTSSCQSDSMKGGDEILPVMKIKQEVIEAEEEQRPSETEGYQVFFMAEDAIKEEEMTQDDVEEQLRRNDTKQNSLQDVEVEMLVTTTSSCQSVGNTSWQNTTQDLDGLSEENKGQDKKKQLNESRVGIPSFESSNQDSSQPPSGENIAKDDTKVGSAVLQIGLGSTDRIVNPVISEHAKGNDGESSAQPGIPGKVVGMDSQRKHDTEAHTVIPLGSHHKFGKMCRRDQTISAKSALHKCFQCPNCHQMCTTKSDFSVHMKTHEAENSHHSSDGHSEASCGVQQSRDITTTREGRKPYPCSDCSRRFASKWELIEHMTKKHFADKPFKCPHCYKGFSKEAPLTQHMMTHKEIESYECSECTQIFFSKYQLKLHIGSHTREKPYSRSHCGKKFALKSSLSEHMENHTEGTPCSKSCQGLNMKIVQSIGKHQTKKGPTTVSVATKCSHKEHVMNSWMVGEKPFKCPYCNKRFHNECVLMRHKRTHRKDKPYQCADCFKRFSHKWEHIEHMMNEHFGEKPFKCPKCYKGFDKEAPLKRHMIIHTKEKP